MLLALYDKTGSPIAVTSVVMTDIMISADDGLVSVGVNSNGPWSSII